MFKDLLILGLAAFGGYTLYKSYKDKEGGDLPSPRDVTAKAVASQPMQVHPLTTVLDPRDDTVNQSWYVGPREVLSTPLTDILADFDSILSDSDLSKEFSTARIV